MKKLLFVFFVIILIISFKNTTLAEGIVIQNINVSDITSNSATINFYSTIPVKCYVMSNAQGAPIGSIATVHELFYTANNHQIIIKGSLTPGTKFYYSLTCQDEQGQMYNTPPLSSSGIDSSGNPIPSFTTLPNPGETIQNINVSDITSNSATINFYSTIPVKCYVMSNAQGAPIGSIATVHELFHTANNHQIIIKGSLTPGTKFYYSLTCQDEQGQMYNTPPLSSSGIDSSGNPIPSFTTLPNPGETIQNINVSDITSNSATINFYSTIPVKCYVMSNAQGAPIGSIATVHELFYTANNHQIIIKGSLTPGTKFYYSLTCQDEQGQMYNTPPLSSSGIDSSGNPIPSFTTLPNPGETIQNINVSDITSNSATINFYSTIPVKCYVMSNAQGAPIGSIATVHELFHTANNHQIIIKGSLTPGTKFYYSLTCQDEQGQMYNTPPLSSSGIDSSGNPIPSFTTLPNPGETIQNINVSDITSNSATINFYSTIPVKCYVMSNAQGAPIGSIATVHELFHTANNHQIIIKGSLTPGTKFYYSLTCQDEQGQMYNTPPLSSSGIDSSGNPIPSFTTLPNPGETIQNINVSDITSNSATINFYSTIPVKCYVMSNAQGAPIGSIATVHELFYTANNHQIIIKGSLTPGTKFYYSLTCQDEQGQMYNTPPLSSSGIDSSGNPIPSFTTLPNPGETIQNINVSDITSNSATINFYSTIPVKCYVMSNAQGAPIGSIATVHELFHTANNHQIIIKGSLTPGTKFYYSLTCQDEQGQMYNTPPLSSSGIDSSGNPIPSFTTLPNPGENEEFEEKNEILKNSYTLKQEVLNREIKRQAPQNSTLTNRLAGRILLQVEEKGEAWYVNPDLQAKYFMGRPHDAFNMMRKFGLGVSESNFKKFQEKGAPNKLAGKILLRVEEKGEAYYVNPVDLKMYYLGRPEDAFRLMRELALGVSNDNIKQIPLGLED